MDFTTALQTLKSGGVILYAQTSVFVRQMLKNYANRNNLTLCDSGIGDYRTLSFTIPYFYDDCGIKRAMPNTPGELPF